MQNDQKMYKVVKRQRKNFRLMSESDVFREKDTSQERIKEKLQLIRESLKGDDNTLEAVEKLPLTLATQHIPIKQIKNGIIEMKDGRFVKIIEVMPVNFGLKNDMAQKRIINAFRGYLKVAPDKGHIKVIARRSDLRDYLAICDEHKKQEPVKTDSVYALHDNYAELVRSTAKEGVTRHFYLIFESKISGHGRFDKAQEELEETAGTASTYLKKCGNQTKKLSTHDSADFLYSFFNRRTSLKIPFPQHIAEIDEQYAQIYEGDPVPFNEYVAPREIDMRSFKYIVMDGTYYTYLMISSKGYHVENYKGWLSLFVNMGEGIDIDIYYEKMPKQAMSSRIATKLKFNRATIADKPGMDENSENIKGAIQSGQYMLRNLRGSEDFYYFNLMITVSSASYEGMMYKKREVIKLLKSRDYRYDLCVLKQDLCFTASMPFHFLAKSLKKSTRRNVLTSGLSSAYPFTSFEMCDADGIVMGLNDENNSLLLLNLFNTQQYKNANMIILGSSGAGKTYTSLLICARSRLCQIPIVFITPMKAHETIRLCKQFDGTFISLNVCHINPMDIRISDTPDDDVLDEGYEKTPLLTQKAAFLQKLCTVRLPDISYDELQYVDTAIVDTYGKFGITFDDSTLFNEDGSYKQMPLIKDLQDTLFELGCDRVARSLNPLVKGSAAHFNSHTDVNLDNPLTFLSIADMPKDMRELGYLIAMDFAYTKAKENRTQRKFIVLEEMWDLIGANATDSTAAQSTEVFKIIRGYGGGVIGVTQDVSDLMAYQNGKFGKGILSACKTKIVLNLEPKEARAVQDALELTDSEIDKIIDLDKGKGMLIANNNNLMINFKSTPLEHDLITTDRADLERIAHERMKGVQAFE